MSARWRSALSQAMIEDLKIAIMPGSAKAATEMFQEMRDYVPPAADAHIVSTNGAQRIEFPTGGRVIFISGRQGVRGYALDKIYASIVGPEHSYANLEPAIVTSRVGEVIYI